MAWPDEAGSIAWLESPILRRRRRRPRGGGITQALYGPWARAPVPVLRSPLSDPGRRLRSRGRMASAPMVTTGLGGIGAIAVTVTYEFELRGLYRVFGDPEYRFYRSNTGPPAESDTPFATSPTLAHEPADTYADGEWWLSVSYFNGVIDSGFLPIGPAGETALHIALAGGDLSGTGEPDAPADWDLIANADGTVTILASYIKGAAPQATGFSYRATYDGSTPPDPDSGPPRTFITGRGPEYMEETLPAQTDGTVVNVKMATYRTSQVAGQFLYTWISPITQKSITVDTAGPAAAASGSTWPGQPPEDF